ncbi:sulfatase [Bacteroidota bacterium]
MTCKFYIAYFLFILLFSGCQEYNKNGTTNDERPNILFIMSDDHANKAISAYHEGLIKTPNIDRLAKEGIIFENAFVTNAICAPSRAVILTGKHSHLNSIKTNHDRFDGSQVTFPKLLQKNGYETALVGKWHLKTEPTGFDYWNILPGQGDYYNPDFINMGDTAVYQGYVTKIIADLALKWMDDRDEQKPFCLMVHHKAPHRNWMPDIKHLDKFENINLPAPSTYHDDYAGRESLKKQKLTVKAHMDYEYDLKIPCDTCPVTEENWWANESFEHEMSRMTVVQKKGWEIGYQSEIETFAKASQLNSILDEWKLQRYLEDYLRCIVSVDESVGQILEYLDSSGLIESTVVVYTSDQGFFLGEHGLFDKRYMYEESMRTPLLIRYPDGIEPGIRSGKLVQNLDIAPTLLDLAGIEIPETMQGESMKVLFGESTDFEWREAIYYHFFEKGWGVDSHYGIRTERYKLIHFYDDSDEWEFFDLDIDPVEMNNLIHNSTYEKTVFELKEQLYELQNHYNDSVH